MEEVLKSHFVQFVGGNTRLKLSEKRKFLKLRFKNFYGKNLSSAPNLGGAN